MTSNEILNQITGKILITGGLGLVGHAITGLLQKYSIEFVIVDNLLYENDFLGPSPFQAGDVGDPKFMIPFLKRNNFGAVIHLAGIVGDAACGCRPEEAQRANIDSVKILSDHFGGGRIIFTSSCSVYGTSESIVTEESPLNPLSMYAEMKIKAEEILKGRSNTTILRLATLHGVSGRLRNDLVVNVLAIKALLSGKMSVFGGEQYRPLLHVQDLADSIVFKLLPFNHNTRISDTFNLVQDNYKIIDIAKCVKKIIPNATIAVTDMPFEDHRNYRASAKKAEKIWGFKSLRKVEDTAIEIETLYRQGRIKDFSNMKYSNISALKFKD